MTTFRYPLFNTDNKRTFPEADYKKAFPDHYTWLIDNGIHFTIEAFYWPITKINIEFDVIIEDVVQAVMFRLYTGIVPLDGDLSWSEN